MAGAVLSNAEARRIALAAQGLGRPRPTRATTRRDIRNAIRDIATLQLDAINVVARTQFLVLFSRIGAFPPARLFELTGPNAELFEYWGHAASLLPMSWQPLFRWRMAQPSPHGDSPKRVAYVKAFARGNAKYIASILDEVRDRGPLTAGQLADPRRRTGEWWDRRSLGRQVLEYLFTRGEVAAWRAPNFERVYDLPERVIPAEVLALPTPSVEDAHRELLAIAARALGIATLSDLAYYFYIQQTAARPRVRELVEAGVLAEVSVEGWKQPAYMPADSKRARPTRTDATLLSPFDPLIWERARTQRLFGFEFTIEVYVPAAKRVYGYYVLPLVLGDSLVGRFDLKADRIASALRVRASHAEPGVEVDAIAEPAANELCRLGQWLGLDHVVVDGADTFSRALRRAMT
jgi:uncharacterized protein YcaQ